MPIDLTDLLVCPRCYANTALGTERSPRGTTVSCAHCGASYVVEDGIPVMLRPDFAAHESDPGLSPGFHHKRQQADFFDHEQDDWETRRPHGAPALHEWVLAEKFRRSVMGLPSDLKGRTVLTVCGGSGLDGEFLARAGARVIVSDISLGAARRARQRARLSGVDMTSLVADAENLPFRNRAIDLVYVHDGLHHLSDPLVGLAEMMRVAAHAISINEPARAALTGLAVRLGLAQEREEAGNPVARITFDEIIQYLESHAFRVVTAHRYALYYQHEPGWAMRWFSTRATFPIAKTGVLMLNQVAGRFGNKLTVQAVRQP
jgi:SAM-dependent methyltransferase/uncharacterized protein YbaR (Trm112 family)